MELLIGLLSSVLIALVPFFWSRYRSRPKVTIEIIQHGGSSSSPGLSAKNVLNTDGYIDGDTALRIFELTWRFKVKITNNSDLTAFFPQLIFNPKGPRLEFVEQLSILEPIKPHQSILLNAEYNSVEEKIGRERTDVGRKLPDEFKTLGILLIYKNSHDTKSYTLFEFTQKKNTFLRSMPREYTVG